MIQLDEIKNPGDRVLVVCEIVETKISKDGVRYLVKPLTADYFQTMTINEGDLR